MVADRRVRRQADERVPGVALPLHARNRSLAKYATGAETPARPAKRTNRNPPCFGWLPVRSIAVERAGVGVGSGVGAGLGEGVGVGLRVGRRLSAMAWRLGLGDALVPAASDNSQQQEDGSDLDELSHRYSW